MLLRSWNSFSNKYLNNFISITICFRILNKYCFAWNNFKQLQLQFWKNKFWTSNFKQVAKFLVQFCTNSSSLIKIITRLMDNYKQYKFFQNKVKQFQYNFSDCLKRDTILNNSILKLFKQFWTSWNDQVADAYLR